MNEHGRAEVRLTELLDVPTLHKIQDALAHLTETCVAICNEQGELVTRPSCPNEFCRLLRSSAQGRRRCDESIAAAAADAQESEASGLETCHAGLIQLAAPIVVEQRRVGAMVLCGRPCSKLTEGQLRDLAERSGVDTERLIAAAEQLASWPERQRRAAAAMLGLLAGAVGRLCQQENQLRQRVEELNAVYNVAGLLAGTRDLQEILDLTARCVCQVMRVKACSIRLLDEETGELVIRAVHNLSREYLDKGPVRLEENPIDREAIEGKTVYIENAPNDPRTRYPEQARREGIVSGLVAGMIYRGKPVGVLRVYTDRPYRFSSFEASLLRAIASQAAAAIINARLYTEALEAERYARQLRYAGEVQRRMIPSHPAPHPKVEFGCAYEPSFEVGGDFYDFVELPEGHLGIVIADVVGKGVPASLMMASLRSALRIYAYTVYHIDEILAHVNKHIWRDSKLGAFATLFYGVISPEGRSMTYCNAGHDRPLLLRDGRIQELDIGGLALGIDPAEVYERAVVELQPGDRLLWYTDGAVDAVNFADETFGRERLQESFIRHSHLEAPLIAKNILWDIRRFVGLAEQADDITLVTAVVR